MDWAQRLIGWGVVLATLLPAVPAGAESVRAQVRQAKKDLIAFEQEIETMVEKFHALRAQYEVLEARVESVRLVARSGRRADSVYERALFSLLVEPYSRRELASMQAHRRLLTDVLTSLRNAIWQESQERRELVDDLDDAIAVLQARRSGTLVTSAGLGPGGLITYSADWAAISRCESSGRWHINVGLFDGGLQFLPSTWWGFGGGQYARYAYQATRKQQIDIAERVLAVQGPRAWPNCFRALPADT